MTVQLPPKFAEMTPRLLKAGQAAAYCSLSRSAFADWIRSGLLPGPIPETHRWDRKAIDAFLDVLSGTSSKTEENALDEWRARHQPHRNLNRRSDK